VLIGDNPFAFGDAGGAGAVWARGRAGEAGEIRLQATHERLGTAAVTIVAREAQW
jgi:hypothetical protein